MKLLTNLKILRSKPWSQLAFSAISKLSLHVKVDCLCVWLIQKLLELEMRLKLYPYEWNDQKTRLKNSTRCSKFLAYFHVIVLLIFTGVKIHVFKETISVLHIYNINSVTEFFICLIQSVTVLNVFYILFINPNDCMNEINHWLMLTKRKIFQSFNV